MRWFCAAEAIPREGWQLQAACGQYPKKMRSKSFLEGGSGPYITRLPHEPDQFICVESCTKHSHKNGFENLVTEETFQLCFFPNINSYPMELVFHRI